MGSKLSYTSAQPFDATFAGGGLWVNGYKINAFMDDDAPFHIEQVLVGEYIFSVNGGMTVAQKPSFARLIVSVIANSEDNQKLQKHFDNVRTVSTDGIEPVTIGIKTANNMKFVFRNCVCLGAEPAFSVDQNGKIRGMKYIFGLPMLHD